MVTGGCKADGTQVYPNWARIVIIRNASHPQTMMGTLMVNPWGGKLRRGAGALFPGPLCSLQRLNRGRLRCPISLIELLLCSIHNWLHASRPIRGMLLARF